LAGWPEKPDRDSALNFSAIGLDDGRQFVTIIAAANKVADRIGEWRMKDVILDNAGKQIAWATDTEYFDLDGNKLFDRRGDNLVDPKSLKVVSHLQNAHKFIPKPKK
jgi:hypothetical protein